MDIPEHLWRFPTAAAISSLAIRFNFPTCHPTGEHMQDWEWEVADSNRINEFLDAYENGQLTDDERFTLMETIIQSFEDLEANMTQHECWAKFLSLIEANINLHIYTVWYWSDLDESWKIMPFLRQIFDRQKHQFVDTL